MTVATAKPRDGEPFGVVGCKCGRGTHATIHGKCAGGHPLPGFPGHALVTGKRSELFWKAAAEAQSDIVRAVLRDKGSTIEDAPETLRREAEGLAQAVLLRDSAFLRVVESGGPLSSSDRARRAFQVWSVCDGRVERHVRTIGTDRVPSGALNVKGMSPDEYIAAQRQREGGAQ